MSKRKQTHKRLLFKSQSQGHTSFNSKYIEPCYQYNESIKKPTDHINDNCSSYYYRHCNYVSKQIPAKSQKIKPYLQCSKETASSKISQNYSSSKVISPKNGQCRLKTFRTMTPSLEIISERLSMKKSERNLQKKQEQLFENMSELLEYYQKSLIKERRQKEVILKENRRLRQKLTHKSFSSQTQYT